MCHVELQQFSLDGENVNHCPECSGIYFTKGQLESIVHIVKLFQAVQLEERDIDTVPDEEKRRILQCPEDGAKMKKTHVAGLTVDICDACGGTWLDDGEITALKMAETHIRGNIQLYVRLGR